LATTLFDNQGDSFLHFVIDAESCVACLACVRECPTDAIAVAGEAPLLQVVDELCIRCGQCYAVCPHEAVRVNGEVGRALAIASQGDGILILSPEMASHFYPATPEQVVNACYEAGFRTVTRGVIGDELVAAEYLKLWREEPWGTLIRSTDPVVVDAVRAQFPELIPYLAPVTTPPVAEARHLRVRFGPGLRIVHAGVNASEGSPDLDAALTFGDLEEVLGARGVNILAQPTWFSRVPEERRRHQSAAGGMPLELLEEFKQASARFRLVRGLDQLPAISRAVTVDRMDLGFVDILSYEGLLDHPLAGPKDQLFWRRALIASTEPPRALAPVLDRTLVASVGAIFQIQPERMEPDGETVAMILKEIGLGPNGRPWDCGACGFDTCQKFAEVAAAGRATLRQCLPYQERRAEDAQKAAAVDLLTGLSTYRVLRDRLSFEIERSRRNGETFAVLFLDLDRFKQVNDTYGHEAGNEILRAASAEIRNAVRASDVAARYGGDEFVVILTRTDLAGATRVAEALRAGIEGVGRRLGYESGLITVSCGIAEFDPKQPGEGDLLVTADRALYRAKAAGRNVVA
jgi:diguanylate cyclase (GGDEF)-like protein